MRYHIDGQDIGVFSQHDLDALQEAFNALSVRRALVSDDAEARKLARSLIHLYRHGIRDPRQLVQAVESQDPNTDVA